MSCEFSRLNRKPAGHPGGDAFTPTQPATMGFHMAEEPIEGGGHRGTASMARLFLKRFPAPHCPQLLQVDRLARRSHDVRHEDLHSALPPRGIAGPRRRGSPPDSSGRSGTRSPAPTPPAGHRRRSTCGSSPSSGSSRRSWNCPHGLARPSVALGACELTLQGGEGSDHLGCLKSAVAPSDGDLAEDARIH